MMRDQEKKYAFIEKDKTLGAKSVRSTVVATSHMWPLST